MKYTKITFVTLSLNFQTNHFTKQVSTLAITITLSVASVTEDTFVKYQHKYTNA